MARYASAEYQHTSAAIRLGEVPDPRLRRVHGGRTTRKAGMTYVAFMAIALSFTALLLVFYISLRSDVTNRLEHISSLETQLNDLKLENDATYSRINSNMDLEEIRNAAIYELGMTYAKEGQIESFTSENGDYVRQLSEIPN